MKKIYLVFSLLICLTALNSSAQFSKLYEFTTDNDLASPQLSEPVSDGVWLYHMTSLGGSSNMGGIYKVRTDGTGYTKLMDFIGISNGSSPQGSLLLYGGQLYGMTKEGGLYNLGCIFRINTDGTGFTILLNFDGSGNGSNPYGSLIESGGVFYGMTYLGGASNVGCVFKINPNGTGYTKVYDFTGAASGINPEGSLVISGNMLFGMTRAGGTMGCGTVFKVKTNGTGFVRMVNFLGAANGCNPYGSLILNGNLLYGMTSTGGSGDYGTIFRIDTSGSGYTLLYSFTGGTSGAYPFGSLLMSGTDLYGTTYMGGTNNIGCIFRITTAGTGFSKLLDFVTGPNGSFPKGSLLLSGGVFYGAASAGSTGNSGCLFSINTDGSSFLKLTDFSGISQGSNPYGPMVYSNNYVYGMTNKGGAAGLGCIFKMDTDGNNFTRIYSFNGTADGSSPYGGLTISGNVMYGMTYSGGANNMGCIFSVNTDGTGYTKLLDFNGATNGSFPYGSLILSGNVLYGMTYQGGSGGMGCIFSIQTNGTGYTKLLNFSGAANGSYPYGSLTLVNGKLFGLTYSGGSSNQGCAFSIRTNGTGYTKLFDFFGANGTYPYGSLVSSGSMLYGMAYSGGGANKGCIFSMDTTGATFTNIQVFGGVATGSYPYGSLTLSNGVLYGATSSGGANSLGCLFKINEGGTGYSRLYSFSGAADGSFPYYHQCAVPGSIFGMTYSGGNNDIGVVYKYALPPTVQASNISTSNITNHQADISWTNGNGEKRAVFVKEGVGAITNPTNNTSYTASTDWNSKGTQLGTSAYYCVYNGTGSNLTLTNLVHGTLYTVQVFEYNGNLLAEQYLTTTASNNPNTFTTLKSDQTISFTPFVTPQTYGAGTFTLTATATSGLGVTFSSNNTSVATVSGNTVTIVGAGDADIIASQIGNQFYNAAPDVSYALHINKASLNATAKDTTRTYGAANPSFTITYVGFVNGDDAADLDVLPIASTAATVMSPVGSYLITLVGGVDNNYMLTDANGTLNITKASLTATADNKSRAYGVANPAFTVSYTGFLNGDDAADLDVVPTASTAATILSSVGTYPITVAGGNDNNYAYTYVSGTLTITQATLTATADNKSRAYGVANPAFTVSYTGFLNGDDAADLDVAPIASTAATILSSVGTYPISVAGGSDNNYAYTYVSGTLTITQATLTATADNKARAYGVANPAFTVSYTGFLNGDDAADLDVVPTASTAATILSSVGTYPISVAGGSDNNYTYIYVSGTLTITQATLTTTADNKSRAYGVANPAFTISYTGFLNGDDAADLDVVPTASTAATILSSAGTYPITVAGGSDNNYAYTYVSGTLTITQATLTATADNKSRAYGVANPTFTITYSGFLNGDDAADLDVVPTASTAATILSSAGTYPITVAGGSDNNYAYTYVSGTLTITQATLTATADNKSRAYGVANPTFTVSYTGFLNGDDAADLDIVPTASTAATILSSVGTYPITLAGGSDNNYTYTYVNGTLTITQATLTATADNKSRAYGVANPAFTISYTGFLNGDDAADLDVVPTASTAATILSSVGTYPITVAGGSDNNYTYTYVSGTLTITQATLTATVDNKSRAYGVTNPTFTITYSGFLNGDDDADLDVIPTASTVATILSSVGTYPITVAGGSDNNYIFSFVSGILTINKASLTATADDKTKEYGTANPPLTITYTGFSGTDDASDLDTEPTASTLATLLSPVGNYTITLTGGIDDNYDFILVDGNLQITKVILTATADDKSKAYGTSNPVLTFIYSGFVGADDPAVLDILPTISTTVTDFTDVGNYPITIAGGSDDYYDFAYVDGNLEVTKIVLTATADEQTRLYGEPNPTLTFSYSGFVGTDDASDVDTEPIAGTLATILSPVGLYAITLSGGIDNNYDFTYIDDTLMINKAVASVQITDTSYIFDGNPKSVTTTTTPVGLSVNVTYDGSAVAPSSIGSYAVLAVIDDPNYEGSDTSTLEILLDVSVGGSSMPEVDIFSEAQSIFIRLSDAGTMQDVTIYNALGAGIYKTSSLSDGLNRISFDVTPGVYFVTLRIDQHQYSAKVVMQ